MTKERPIRTKSPAKASKAVVKLTKAAPKMAAPMAPEETAIYKVFAVYYEVAFDNGECDQAVHPKNIKFVSRGDDSDETGSYVILVGDVVEAKLNGKGEMIPGKVTKYTYRVYTSFPAPKVSTTDSIQQRLELNRGLPLTRGGVGVSAMSTSHTNERINTKNLLKACAALPSDNDILQNPRSTIIRWYPNCTNDCEKILCAFADNHVHPIVEQATTNGEVLAPGILPRYDTPKPTPSNNGCIHAGVYASAKHASTTQCCACVFPYHIKHSSVSHYGCRLSIQIVISSTTKGRETRSGASASVTTTNSAGSGKGDDTHDEKLDDGDQDEVVELDETPEIINSETDAGDKLEKGDKVVAKFEGKDEMFPGKVYGVNSDGTYEVKFDNGVRDKAVQHKNIKAMEPKIIQLRQLLNQLQVENEQQRVKIETVKEEQQASITEQLDFVDAFVANEHDFTISQCPESPVQRVLRRETAGLLYSVSNGYNEKKFGGKLTSTEFASTWRDLGARELVELYNAIMGEAVSTL